MTQLKLAQSSPFPTVKGYNNKAAFYHNICLPLALAAFYPKTHYLHFVYGLGYHFLPTVKNEEYNKWNWKKIANFLHMNDWGVINVKNSFSEAFPFIPNKRFRQCAVSTFVKNFNNGIIIIQGSKGFNHSSHALVFADGYIYDPQHFDSWMPVKKHPSKLKRVVFAYYPLESMT